MRKASIVRVRTGDSGTFGRLILDDGWTCFTGELPWRHNQTGKSCIPAGVYPGHVMPSYSYGIRYALTAVPGRHDLEIHPANWVGDKDKGLKCQLVGCISLGLDIGVLDGQHALLHSSGAVSQLVTHLDFGDPFMLSICESYHGELEGLLGQLGCGALVDSLFGNVARLRP